jgi:hypothetical protein
MSATGYKLFKETTKDWSSPVTNHIYMLSPDKQWMYGMVMPETRELRVFKNRIQFSTRYRTFKVVTSKDQI